MQAQSGDQICPQAVKCSANPAKQIPPEKITVAIFCALPEESVAVRYSLDEKLECRYNTIGPRNYIYSFGRIGDHNVVIARPSQMGPISAALCAATVNQQFPNVRFALMVGIGAGIPNLPKRDIRLGDIAVSIPRDNHPGVLQYDFGKYEQDGKFVLKGTLNKPPPILLNADGSLEEDELMDDSPVSTILGDITKQRGFARPTCDDVLFDPAFRHVGSGPDCNQCKLSDNKEIVLRPEREEGRERPVVHRGLILSGGGVVKTPEDRDRLRRDQTDAICFEMEAAGIADELPCLVVRGICDYADTHKQDSWHRYAAAVAAAYAKAILLKFNGPEVEETTTMRETMQELEKTMRQISDHVQNLRTVAANTQKDLAEYHDKELHGQTLEWLSPIDPSVRHAELRTGRLSGTCERILENSDFQQWVLSPPNKDSSDARCWVGDPGQGKTFTMSRVIDHLCDSYQSGSKIYTTYLYCDYQRTRGYSATALVGAIVRQLLAQFDTVPGPIAELVRHAHIKLRRSSARMDEIHQILALLNIEVVRLFVCIDALDECNDAENFVAACESFPLKASFLFIGRHSIAQVVKRRFPNSSHQAMQPQNDDITAVISARIEEEKARQPDMMPDWLAYKIRTEISKLANGMFLLASLHTTLVLSHGTIHQRQQSLLNLPNTLENTFGQTLKRIRDQNNNLQAFKILAWIHCVGSLSLDELRHALAVECHHTQFQKDNLPSPFTILDCCLGLVRLDTTQRDLAREDSLPGGQPRLAAQFRGNVTLVHSTLSVYFESYPATLDEVIPTIAMTCLTYFKFLEQDQPTIIRRLMNDSWVRLLCVSKMPPPELLDIAWGYCIALNTFINKHKYVKNLLPDMLPKPSRSLASRTAPLQFTTARWQGQSLIHTACMLGLDCLDQFLPRLTQSARESRYKVFNEIDAFGMSPLGWTLLSANHFDAHQSLEIRPSAFDSFEYSLWRAERIIKAIPGLDPHQNLWDLGALEGIRNGVTRTQRGARVSYLSRSPSLFFLGNQSSSPDATHRCISLMATHLKFNIWSTFRGDARSSGSMMTNPSSWRIVVVNINEEAHSKLSPSPMISMPQIISENPVSAAKKLAAQVATPAVRRESWQEEPEPPPLGVNLGVVWLGKEVTAIFEPGAEAPIVVTTDWMQYRAESYCEDRKDIVTDNTNPFPGTKCTSMIVPRASLLHIGAAGDSVVMIDFALTTCKLNPNLKDQDGQTALHLALRRRSSFAYSMLLDWSGVDFGAQDSKEMTALHICAENQLTSSAVAILNKKHNVHVDLQDKRWKTALHYAAEVRSKAIVNLLLKHGASVNIEDASGNTPLHVAIINRDAILCGILSEPRSGHNISSNNLQKSWKLASQAGASFMMTVLRLLQSKSQIHLLAGGPSSSSETLQQSGKVVQLFLNANTGSAFTEKDLDFVLKLSNETGSGSGSKSSSITLRGGDLYVHPANAGAAIRQAMVNGAGNVTVFLIRRFPVDLNHLGENGESALHLAVVYNVPQVVQFLLQNSTDLDFSLVDPQGYTAIQLALIHQRVDILQILLESQRIEVNQVHNNLTTTLHLAVIRGFSDAVPLLLQCSHITVNDLDGSGRTPLHYAVTHQDTTIAQLLLGCARVDAEILSRDGRTALEFAALCAGKEMVCMLIRTRKFNLHHRDSYGKTAHDWAKQNGNTEVAKILEGAESG